MSPRPWPRSVAFGAAALLTGVAAVATSPLTATAQLTDAQVIGGNTMTTRAACPSGPFYATAVLAEGPSFYWRFGETTPPAVTTVADATTNGADAVVRGAGLSFGSATPGLVDCDDSYGVELPGTPASTEFLVQPTAVANPDTFTVSAWIRTSTSDGGWVVGMGSARWGTSASRDRVLYVQSNGQPAFSVGIGPRNVLEASTPVNDNQPHLLVGTLGPAGMALYVDGVQVDADPSVTAGAVYTGNEPADQPPPAVPATPDGYGYWRVGYDSTAGLGPAAPSNDQLAGRIDEVAVWETRALTAGDVAGLFAQNHW